VTIEQMVIPANAGTQEDEGTTLWMPAFAGMTPLPKKTAAGLESCGRDDFRQGFVRTWYDVGRGGCRAGETKPMRNVV
jgi:hypothetical protein